jgi:hypothetical protein
LKAPDTDENDSSNINSVNHLRGEKTGDREHQPPHQFVNQADDGMLVSR